MRNLLMANKMVTAIITTLLGLLISWGVWATTSIFRQESKQSVGMERDTTMQQSVEELKTDVKDFKREVKEGFADVDQKQEKVIDLLMDIKKGK